MLSSFNSTTFFRKNSWSLAWLISYWSFIERKICAACYDSSFSKIPRISSRETWGYDRSSGYQLFVARLFPFPLSLLQNDMVLLWELPVLRRFWSSDHSSAKLKVSKIKYLLWKINEPWRLVQDLNFLRHVQVYYKPRFLFSNNFYSTSRLLNFSNTILNRERCPLKNKLL